MTNNTWSRKVVAILAAAAILSAYSTFTLATPGARGGELSVFGEVALNGRQATTGLTIFSECVIVTGEGSSASVSLGKLGRIELLSNTNLRLSFTDKSITGLLQLGRARFSIPAGVLLNLATPDGSVIADGSQSTSFTVNTEKANPIVVTESGSVDLRSGTVVTKIIPGESGSGGAPQTPKKDDEDNHRGSLWAAWLATGSVIALAIWVVMHEKEPHQDDLDFGGTVVNPSL